jgi:DNA polymerase-3 subunit epsilon
MPRPNRKKLSQFAQDILDSNPVYLDTETTGIDDRAEVVEISVLDSDGSPLLDTLIKPQAKIPAQVSKIHGITNAMVADALALPEVWEQVDQILQSRVVVIYNSAFDLRLLAQSARRHGIFPRQPPLSHCAMLIYAEYYGRWNADRESYVWQRLGEAARQCGIEVDAQLHRAAADCAVTRRIMLHMAAGGAAR